MTEYALDTDTATLLLRGHAQVCARGAAVKAEQLSVTIITVEEILTGWYSQIRRAKNDEQVLRAYASLQQGVEFLGGCGSCLWTNRRWNSFMHFVRASTVLGATI
jgi:hypothetical protein